MINQWRTPVVGGGGASLEELKKIAAGDWLRPSGERRQLNLQYQIRNCDLYPPNNKKEEISKTAQLNPDWTEWLMGWPIGWTNLKPLSKEAFVKWFEMVLGGIWWDKDPANIGELSRVTENKVNRTKRIKALGNGQVPLCVVTATINLEKIKNL